MELPQLKKLSPYAAWQVKSKAKSGFILAPKRGLSEKSQIFDPRGFEYFNQLPQDIQLTVFDYLPFYDWILKLSPVCADWRKLVTRSNRQKILSIKTLEEVTQAAVTTTMMIEIMKSYQIYGLELLQHELDLTKVPELLAASKMLNWVSIPAHVTPNIKNPIHIDMVPVPNTVSSVCFLRWDEYLYFKELFVNIKELKVCQSGEEEYLEHFVLHPQLKILHTVAEDYDIAADMITRIRSFAPKIEVLHLLVGGAQRKKKDTKRGPGRNEFKTEAQSPLEKEKQLEKLAESVGITLYCRNLFDLIRDPNSFVESFLKQGLPYSYYVRGDSTKTLLMEACHSLSLPVVKFLLENGHTTLEREYGQPNVLNPFNRMMVDFDERRKKQRIDPYLFSGCEWQFDESVDMMDYLLKKGYDVHKQKPKRESIFEALDPEFVQYILEHTEVNLKHVVNDDGDTVLHVLLNDEKYGGLRSITEKLSKEEINQLFETKNSHGDTPLHTATTFDNNLLEYLIGLGLGALWTMPNASNETPLSLILDKQKCSLDKFNTILRTIPSVPSGLVSDFFACSSDVETFHVTVNLLAELGANFNEIVNGDPAITKLAVPVDIPTLRGLAGLGIDFNVVDSKKETVLFRAVEGEVTVEVLDMLVNELGLNVNQVNDSGITPLLRALQGAKPADIIAKLIELGADVNHCSGTNGALLFAALYYRKSMQPRVFHRSESQVRVLEELLKAGADPHVKHYSENRNDVVILPLLSILNSAIDHDGKLVDLFVKYGAKLNNIRDDAGNTLLHLTEQHYAQYLLKFIDVNETNIYGQTPLWNPKLDLPTIESMLQLAPDLANHVANDGSTALHAHHGGSTTQLFLLSLDNIDLSVVNKRGQSFMHTKDNGPDVFSYIVAAHARQSDESKAQIRRAFNTVDVFGRTVLHYVCDHDLTFAKNMIETFNIDVNPNSRALNLQIGWSNDILEYLLAKGSNPNAQSAASGDTFLHFICGDQSKADLIRTLLKYGASIDVKNWSGISPVDLDPNLTTGYQFAGWSLFFQNSEPTIKPSKKRYNAESDEEEMLDVWDKQLHAYRKQHI